MLKLKSKIDNEIIDEEVLREKWEEDLFEIARDEKIKIKKVEEQYLFEQFIADLLETGEYEIIENEKTKKYIVGIMGIVNGEYILSVLDKIYNNFNGLEKIVKNELERLKNEDEFGRIFMAFGGKYIEKEKDGCVAEYYIQEMRTNTLVIKYKVYEVEV